MSMNRHRILVPVLLAALLSLSGPAARLEARGRGKAKVKPPAFPAHIVLVIFGGGVRGQDLGDPQRTPTLAAMAARGRRVEKVVSGAPDGYAATARILTGNAALVDGSKKPRPAQPTICEIVRAGLHLPREKVWYVSYEGGDQLHLAYSAHPKYGAVFRPGEAYGEGAFAQPLASFLEVMGRPLPMEPGVWTPLRRLRSLSRRAASVWLPRGVDVGLPASERVERALLRELDRKALLNRGPNPRDEQAVRAALTVLAIHRPVLTVVRLGEAAQAQASYEAYLRVLAADDGGVARLRAAVAADARMAGRTTFVVLADRGRDAAPDAGGRLGAQDASKQRAWVPVIIDGPGLKRRRGRSPERSIDDVAPSIAHLLGLAAEHATGHAWLDLLRGR